MVTVDEKLALFTKVLEQCNNDKMQQEIYAMEKHYQEKLQDVRQAVAIEARAIIANHVKDAERACLATQSKARQAAKKNHTWIKEKYVEQFMAALTKKFEAFRDTEAYGVYMKRLLEKMPAPPANHPIHIVLTPSDYKAWGHSVEAVLSERGFTSEQFIIAQGEASRLGGFIWLDPIAAIRIDCSVQTRFATHKEWIAGVIFHALTEGGV